ALHNDVVLKKKLEKEKNKKNTTVQTTINLVGNTTSHVQSKITHSLSQWISSAGRPPLLVEDEGFKKFMKVVCPSYNVPKADALSHYMHQDYRAIKIKLIA